MIQVINTYPLLGCCIGSLFTTFFPMAIAYGIGKYGSPVKIQISENWKKKENNY